VLIIILRGEGNFVLSAFEQRRKNPFTFTSWYIQIQASNILVYSNTSIKHLGIFKYKHQTSWYIQIQASNILPSYKWLGNVLTTVISRKDLHFDTGYYVLR